MSELPQIDAFAHLRKNGVSDCICLALRPFTVRLVHLKFHKSEQPDQVTLLSIHLR